MCRRETTFVSHEEDAFSEMAAVVSKNEPFGSDCQYFSGIQDALDHLRATFAAATPDYAVSARGPAPRPDYAALEARREAEGVALVQSGSSTDTAADTKKAQTRLKRKRIEENNKRMVEVACAEASSCTSRGHGGCPPHGCAPPHGACYLAWLNATTTPEEMTRKDFKAAQEALRLPRYAGCNGYAAFAYPEPLGENDRAHFVLKLKVTWTLGGEDDTVEVHRAVAKHTGRKRAKKKKKKKKKDNNKNKAGAGAGAGAQTDFILESV